jgi:rare lipoprotein A
MHRAFIKHVPRANLSSYALRVAMLGLWAVLALPASAQASAGGGAAARTAAVESESSTASPTGGTATAGATANGATTPSDPQQPSKPTLATWFGPGFYGDQTACGQTMSPALVGVASRTLACGTLVQIGYHGRHLTVPVVDRGPYGHIGAVWDLTAGTARALKIKETVRITTAIVGSLPNTPTLGQPTEASLPGAETAPASSSSSSPTAATSAAASTGGAVAN